MMNKHMQKNRGYTLLFAVLVSSILLSVGISILNISKKEFLIATSARDSSAAFYAADSGLECAIHADDKGVFATTDNIDNTQQPDWLKCNVPYSFETPVLNNPEGVFVFHIKSGSADIDSQNAGDIAGKSCAVITVRKVSFTEDNQTRIRTIIESRGYNTGWSPDPDPNLRRSKGTCSLLSAKRVERALSYSY